MSVHVDLSFIYNLQTSGNIVYQIVDFVSVQSEALVMLCTDVGNYTS